MSYATKEQLQSLMADISSRINIPTIGIGGGYAPIGTIIAYMGATAPQDYLACDGSVHNIADYSQLANFIEAQFGSKNYFGGDGVTTFGVPDLQCTITSAIYCIKAFVGGEDVYSTDERVVGHWLDGKPIYRKTVIIPVAKGTTVNYDIRAEQTDLDIFIGYEVHGIVYTSYGKNYINIDSSLNSGNTGIKYTDNGRGINNNTSGVDNARKLSFVNNYNSSPGDADVYLTLKYTKTTD